MRRLVPEEFGDDEAFLYANEVVHERRRGRWILRLDPEACLTGPAMETDVQSIQDGELHVERSPDRARYVGKVLFSAGVVLFVDGKQVLLQRGEGAPVDAGKWTSPAGRCDGTPRHTALKEFYEELVVLYGEDHRPVFLEVDAESNAFQDVYASSLAETAGSTRPDDWIAIPGMTPDDVRRHYTTVVVEFGNAQFTSEMLAYFHEESNTLELRLASWVETPPGFTPSNLVFRDVEFDRAIDRFGGGELEEKYAADELVPTDAYLVSSRTLL